MRKNPRFKSKYRVKKAQKKPKTAKMVDIKHKSGRKMHIQNV
jgi:hypothetical protein